jgi:hypothetical protein
MKGANETTISTIEHKPNHILNPSKNLSWQSWQSYLELWISYLLAESGTGKSRKNQFRHQCLTPFFSDAVNE